MNASKKSSRFALATVILAVVICGVYLGFNKYEEHKNMILTRLDTINKEIAELEENRKEEISIYLDVMLALNEKALADGVISEDEEGEINYYDFVLKPGNWYHWEMSLLKDERSDLEKRIKKFL